MIEACNIAWLEVFTLERADLNQSVRIVFTSFLVSEDLLTMLAAIKLHFVQSFNVFFSLLCILHKISSAAGTLRVRALLNAVQAEFLIALLTILEDFYYIEADWTFKVIQRFLMLFNCSLF